MDDWNLVEKLLRVRSLWGPQTGSRLDKVMLDVTEGPFRMRKKMMKNDMFYIHYPYRPNLEDRILCMEAAPIQKTSDVDLDNTTEITTGSPEGETRLIPALDVPSSPTTKADNQTILHFIGEKERISHMFRCARIQGLDTAEGLLLFGKEHFYVIDGFTLLRTKEIKDIDSLAT
ncbi:WD repeat and FYVE domain-containing protein 3 [Bulinus truncatus]|nr:WD repeat and FYVE domain-containing protein 3 [Bulinus truncatus]